jgi:hypothetical protein
VLKAKSGTAYPLIFSEQFCKLLDNLEVLSDVRAIAAADRFSDSPLATESRRF